MFITHAFQKHRLCLRWALHLIASWNSHGSGVHLSRLTKTTLVAEVVKVDPVMTVGALTKWSIGII